MLYTSDSQPVGRDPKVGRGNLPGGSPRQVKGLTGERADR